MSTTNDVSMENPPSAAETEEVQVNKRTPSEFLKSVLGRPVDVKLNNGVEYRGILACLDGYMNIAMEQTKEYVNGQLNSQYGDCFIRGNNANLPENTLAPVVIQMLTDDIF